MTDVPTSASPPPGWYAESPHAARLRWWNGSAWTEHYQAATDTSAIPAPVETPAAVVGPVPEPLPTTRAARRAAATAAMDTTGADQAVPVWAAMSARTTEHDAVAPLAVPAPDAAVPAPELSVTAPSEPHREPAPAAGPLGGGAGAQPAIWPPPAPVEPFGWGATASPDAEPTGDAPAPPASAASTATDAGAEKLPVARAFAPEAFPDQILGRSARAGDYRPPLPPVAYQPHAYVAVPGANFIPVTSRNGPASASLALSFLGVVAGILVHALVTPTNPSLAGLLNLLIIAAFLSALGLAVVALVLAAQRPTRKGRSVFALVVSALLLIGTCTAFALRLIPVGALYSGG
jgi:hypothetical protein